MSEQPLNRPATPMLRQIQDRPGVKEMLLGVPVPLKAIGALFGLVGLAVMAGIGFLVVDGRLDGHWYDVRDLGNAVQGLRGWLGDQGVDHRITWIITGTIGAVCIMSVLGGSRAREVPDPRRPEPHRPLRPSPAHRRRGEADDQGDRDPPRG